MGTHEASIDTQTAGLWLLVIAAALASTEVGTAQVADSPVASAIGAVIAAGVSAAAVLAWRPPAGTLLTASALCTAGAAAIHFAVTDRHFDEWWGFGLFFLASGWVQLLWATATVRIRSRRLVALGLAGNTVAILLWLVTRTVGLPFGPQPGEAEALGWADAIATAFELVAALCCLVLLVRPFALSRRIPPLLLGAGTAALTVLALLAVTSGAHHH